MTRYIDTDNKTNSKLIGIVINGFLEKNVQFRTHQCNESKVLHTYVISEFFDCLLFMLNEIFLKETFINL